MTPLTSPSPDQGDPGAGGAHLGDQLGVTRPVEDADDEVGDLGLLRLRQVPEVDRRLLVEIDQIVGQPAADRDLVHIDVRARSESPRHRPSR